MSRIALCTDSSALLPARAAERLGVTVVPIAITLDGAAFRERDDAIDEFYARLSEGARATTSQPSPGEFLEAYGRAAAAGAEEVLSIHLDARISGTVRSAELAARGSSIPVTVVDAKTASFGVGLCVRAAATALARGVSPSEAAHKALSLGRTLRNAFVAYAHPRGRLPDAAGWSLFQFADGRSSRSQLASGSTTRSRPWPDGSSPRTERYGRLSATPPRQPRRRPMPSPLRWKA